MYSSMGPWFHTALRSFVSLTTEALADQRISRASCVIIADKQSVVPQLDEIIWTVIGVLKRKEATAANCSKQVYVSAILESRGFPADMAHPPMFSICDLDLETTSMSESRVMGSAVVFDG